MKRFLSMLLILTMLISLVRCKLINRGKNLKINGVSIKDYTIVCDTDGLDYNVRAAEYIRDSIKSLTKKDISIVDDSTPVGEYEIIVGETSRAMSAELNEKTEGVEFSMLAKNGSVALEGDYFVIAAAAYYFAETYVKGGSVDIPDGVTVREPVVKEARNFIMLIGDGMGVYQSKLFDYMTDESGFSDGEDIFYGYMLPYHGYARTDSYVKDDDGILTGGTTDSAASGTALATGYKTVYGSVGIDKDGKDLKSLTELANELGKATAVISTDKDTGATPSAFSAHAPNRDDITEILLDQNVLKGNGTIIQCVNRSNCNAKSVKDVEEDITNTLNTLAKDEDGFFLMYEEGHIDKKSHNEDMEQTFLALIRFNQAIALFMEYAFYNPDTLVVITADHETGGLLPDNNGKLTYTNDGDHTSADVPVFAWGFDTDFFGNERVVENVEIAKFFAAEMGVSDFGDPSDLWYEDIYGDAGEDGEGDNVPEAPNKDGVTLPTIPIP